MESTLTKVINLLIIEDHPFIRNGVKLMLNSEKKYTFNYTEVITGEQAYDVLKLKKFDVILLDISLADLSGIELFKKLKSLSGFNTPVIFQTMHNDLYTVNEALSLNANGYLLKVEEPHVLMRAIEKVLKGGKFYSKKVANHIHTIKMSKKRTKLNQLSPRENDVLLLSAKGMSCKEIGEILGISFRTVEGHRQRIFQKLEIDSISKLIAYVNGKVVL